METDAKEVLRCLICGVPIIHAHMGVNSCRACAVFYKRTLTLNRALRCKRGKDNCQLEKSSCRKCRFNRFDEVMKRACAGENRDSLQADDSVSDSEQGSEMLVDDEPTPSFIDHSSEFECSRLSSQTPLLDRMKRAYKTLCKVRKSGEMGALHYGTLHDLLLSDAMKLLPAKYSAVLPNAHILFCGLMDFGRSAFQEFKDLSPQSRLSLISHSFKLVLTLDSAYRAYHYFPDGERTMASYMTYIDDSTLEEFLADCPFEINKVEAAKQLSKNQNRDAIILKNVFREVKPSIEEFIALFGLAFWSDKTPEMTDISSKIRRDIMKELHHVYTRRGITDNATRLGQVLCLLVTVERVHDLIDENLQVYRMMNLFNEAFEDNKLYKAS
ncbi:hypothetical protein PMAYCL1PPCAC_16778 [Pristionchus mayeri]|uniref:Nuclear receptor n=1 Tax=Pristionchus mayeri TaxID=1317129 RepID=A0AAN5CLH8_9BILA|nr:hypothetical protein PMAYCL1PPCAC_16778 [Pristionchus mayeri]